jgi:RNA polymerase sigma-70 factor, ECF subfamily
LSRDIEEKLIEEAIEGDQAAFNRIYFLLRDSVYGFAFRMLGEGSSAEDITQEVFIFFIENPRKFQPERGSLLSFLCGVARNHVMHHLRKKGYRLEVSREETNDFIEPRDDLRIDPLRALLEWEFKEKVIESIASLSPNQREVIILREMQELSYEEIAQVVGADINSVKVRLHRARRRLANLLTPYLLTGKRDYYEVH